MSPKSKKIILRFLPVMVIVIISACALPWAKQAPEISITSEPPTTAITQDLSAFQNIGCTWQSENYAVCPEGSIPKKMGCDALSTSSEYVNLLDAESQFINCTYAPQLQTPPDETLAKGLYDSGCSIEVKQRLLVYGNGDYLLVRDLEDLKYNFAPITTPEQALAYAITATGSEARYDLESLSGYRILSEELQETTVQPVEGGFQVVLFDYSACGCGPHTTFMQTINVSSDGEIEYVKSTAAFENPEEDGLCVD